uniref:BEN domain containing 2 n=1 Tax=Coturnix japonica TaxID=93934 RepID=A0A8C2U2U6_COTJA
MQRGNGDVPEQMDFVSLCNKRKRFAPAPLGQNVVRTSEGEYEDSESVIYEYEPDYECASVVSEASCIGDQQKTLAEVLSYCQAMYDSIQKLDKKLDLLHRKVSEMQHTCARPLLLKPKPVGFIYRSSSHLPQGRVRVQKSMERDSRLHLSSSGRGRHNPVIRAALHNSHVQVNSTTNSVQRTMKLESQQPVLRQSPPLPTIVSTHSLHSQFTAAESIPDLLPQPDLSATLESTVNTASSPASSSVMPAPSETGLGNEAVVENYGDSSGSVSISKEVPSSSLSIHPSFELLGSPWHNVQLPLSVIYVAKGKSRPELSARYLIRHLFTEDVLVKSNVYGNIERGMSPLDCNKINALRDFLQENYPSFDLKETRYDLKACVDAMNSTVSSLRCDYKKATAEILQRILAVHPNGSPPERPSSVKPCGSDTISLIDKLS